MKNEITEVELSDLDEFLKDPKAVLIDIRETWEFQDFNIGGINIPAHLINEHIDSLKGYNKIVIACSNGTRSSILARVYKKKLPEAAIYHLTEGVF
jgi:rhodanese-related sulfurtransferase